MVVTQVQFRVVLAVFGLVAMAAPANADGGIKLTSESRMHPLIQGGVAFDTNPHRASGDTADSDMYLLLQGGFEIAVPSDRLDVRMHNVISYHHYLGLMGSASGNTANLSTVKGGTALQLLGNRKGKMRWGTALKINRLDEPEPLNLGVRQGRWSNSAEGFLEWRPGGRAIGIKPSVSLGTDTYDATSSGATDLNRLSPGLRLDIDWRFLPRTQIVLNNAWTASLYTNDDSNNGYADPVSSELGIMGQVSPRLSVIVAGGYSGSQFYLSSKGEGLHTFSGQAEIRYDEQRKVTWRLGARRRLLPVTMFGFMTENSAYARYSERYRGGFRVVTQLKGNLRTFGTLTAGDIISITDGSERADLSAGFDANLLWQPKKSWMIGLTNRFELFNTNSAFKSAGAQGDNFVDPSFARNLSMLVFEAKY